MQHTIICESINSRIFKLVFDCSKTQKKISGVTVRKDSKVLKFVPDFFKTQEICEIAVKNSYL